jgi:hypothetical protein
MSANKLSTLPWLMFMKCTLYTKSFKLRKEFFFGNALFRKMLIYESVPGERFEITFWEGNKHFSVYGKQVCKVLLARGINLSDM